MHVIRTLIKGVLSLAALAGLLVGMPMLLVRYVGNPLPTSVPNWGFVWDSITIGNVPTNVIVNVLASIMWLAWTMVAWAIIVEGFNSARGRISNPRRVVAAPFHLSAAKLIATAALLLTLLPRFQLAAPASAEPLGDAMRTPTPVPVLSIHMPQTPPQTAPDAPSPAAVDATTWTIGRGDNLYDIAEVTLGDGNRWPEIFELNKHRRQPDGRALIQPDVLERGWMLTLPVGANAQVVPASVDNSDVRSQPTPGPGSTHRVAVGESLWAIADHELGDGHRYPEVFDMNRGVLQADGGALTDPNLIRPGWDLHIPTPPLADTTPVTDGRPTNPRDTAPTTSPAADPAPDEAAPAPEPAPSAGAEGSGQITMTMLPDSPPTPPWAEASTETLDVITGPEPSTEGPSSTTESGTALISTWGAAGGLLAAGALASYRLRRQRQRVRRRPGHQAPALPAAEANLLAEASADAADSDAEHLTTLIRSITFDTRRDTIITARPVAVVANSKRIRIDLAEPTTVAPVGWRLGDDGRSWEAPRRQQVEDRDTAISMPALATVGGSVGSPVLVDLESLGVVSIIGDANTAEALARSFALELTQSPAADNTTVLVHGLDLGGFVNERLVVCDDLDAATARLRQTTKACAEALATAGYPSAFSARVSGRTADGLAPTVLVTTEVNDGLLELAQELPGSCGAAIVVVGELNVPAVVIDVQDDVVAVPELEIRCPAQQVATATAALLAQALAIASAESVPVEAVDSVVLAMRIAHNDDAGITPTAAGEDVEIDLRSGAAAVHTAARDESDADGLPATPEFTDAAPALLVRLLGPVEVLGSHDHLTAQHIAVLAYVGTHPGADIASLREALWRDNQPTQRRTYNVLSELRSIAGVDAFPFAPSGSLQLGDAAGTDLDLFEARIVAARSQPLRTAMRTLAGALDLVDGVPLQYPTKAARYYTWVDLENLASYWERKVGDAAHQVVEWALAEGHPPLAESAARRGLLACPLNRSLTEDLARTYEAMGEPGSARRVMEEYDRALESLALAE